MNIYIHTHEYQYVYRVREHGDLISTTIPPVPELDEFLETNCA